jgi:hypothetical protein
MNPFLTFLIFVPLLASLFVVAGSVLGLTLHGPRWDIISIILIFSVISLFLSFLFKRSLTSDGSLITIPGNNTNESLRRKFTNVVLFPAYLVLLSMALFIFNTYALRGWMGTVGFLLGLSLLLSGYLHLRSVRNKPLSMFGDGYQNRLALFEQTTATFLKTRNMVLILNAFVAIITIWFYFHSQGAQVLSRLDFFGLLFLLGTSCVWFVDCGNVMQNKVNLLKKQLGVSR